MKPSIREQLEKAGYKSREKPKKPELPVIPGEAEIEAQGIVATLNQSLYRTKAKANLPYRHRYGDVKITEVKKRMDRKPIDKMAVSYMVLDIAVREQSFTTDQMLKWLPAGTKRSTMASALVSFCQSGVMTVSKEALDGRKYYSVTEADKRLGTEALYARYLDWKLNRNSSRTNNGKAPKEKPEKKAPAPGPAVPGIPSVIEVHITGTIEHVFTFKLGR